MSPKGKPTFHHMNHSQSQRILWLLEELGIPYNLELHARQTSGAQKHRAPPELAEIHPMGRAPQLVTSDGRTIAETSAIAVYLLRTYDTGKRFAPTDDVQNDWVRDEQLTSFAGATLGPVMAIKLFIDVLVGQSPFFIRPLTKLFEYGVDSSFVQPEFARMLSYLESELEGRDFFMGGTLGRADFMLSFPLDMIAQRNWVDFDKYPKLQAWRERCQARPAWKSATEKGNGYDLTVF